MAKTLIKAFQMAILRTNLLCGGSPQKMSIKIHDQRLNLFLTAIILQAAQNLCSDGPSWFLLILSHHDFNPLIAFIYILVKHINNWFTVAIILQGLEVSSENFKR